MANFELKPCPFCGKNAHIENAGESSYRIVCSGCGARSGRVFVKKWHSTKFVAQGQAAKLWNTRAKDSDDKDVYPLLEFVKQKVPFRLKEVFCIPDDLLTPSVVDDIIWSLYDHSDVMFDYDSMDEFISERLKKFDIDPDDYKEDEDE